MSAYDEMNFDTENEAMAIHVYVQYEDGERLAHGVRYAKTAAVRLTLAEMVSQGMKYAETALLYNLEKRS